MASILFGECSVLTVEIGQAFVLIKQEVSTIKVGIASDFRYPEKNPLRLQGLHPMLALPLCKQQEDRLAINDRIIDMDPVIKQILINSLTIDLPIFFVTAATDPARKKEGDITPAGQQQGAEKRGKKHTGKGDNNAACKHIKNKKNVKEFKMKEGKVWRCDLAVKNTKDRPKWNDKNCWMCMRWFSKGDCFTNCNNKDCHVSAADVPTDKKA